MTSRIPDFISTDTTDPDELRELLVRFFMGELSESEEDLVHERLVQEEKSLHPIYLQAVREVAETQHFLRLMAQELTRSAGNAVERLPGNSISPSRTTVLPEAALPEAAISSPKRTDRWRSFITTSVVLAVGLVAGAAFVRLYDMSDSTHLAVNSGINDGEGQSDLEGGVILRGDPSDRVCVPEVSSGEEQYREALDILDPPETQVSDDEEIGTAPEPLRVTLNPETWAVDVLCGDSDRSSPAFTDRLDAIHRRYDEVWKNRFDPAAYAVRLDPEMTDEELISLVNEGIVRITQGGTPQTDRVEPLRTALRVAVLRLSLAPEDVLVGEAVPVCLMGLAEVSDTDDLSTSIPKLMERLRLYRMILQRLNHEQPCYTYAEERYRSTLAELESRTTEFIQEMKAMLPSETP